MDKGPPTGHGPAPRARLELAVVAGDAITIVPLPAQGSLALGRAEDCDIRIDNRSVSRRHALLHLGPPLAIEDLDSANGTFVGDTRTITATGRTFPLRRLSKQKVDIAIGERVNLGFVTIMVRRVAAGAPRTAGADAPDDGCLVRDPAMRALYEQVDRAARSTISVLILGETGVGKEVLAHAIHRRSTRAQKPFLELNCAALPASLLEGELFGHEKDAFTGAGQARAGLIESADGGTVFLDEVGELPLTVQVKLLRVLEDRKVTRLGGRSPRKLDVRFVAATNRNVEVEIEKGNFRQDLYFRLNGVSFTIPPLRARVVEIAPLAERFLAEVCRQIDRAEPLRLSPQVLGHLERYEWPGNVRELRNTVERAAVLCNGGALLPEDLPEHVTGVAKGQAQSDRAQPEAAPGLDEATAPAKAAERQRIMDALEQCAGNQTRAAKLLGVSLRTLVKRLSEYDVPRPRKRP